MYDSLSLNLVEAHDCYSVTDEDPRGRNVLHFNHLNQLLKNLLLLLSLSLACLYYAGNHRMAILDSRY